ncbi:Tudor-knot domain-containing protein [Candidatus Magnetomonas plexicatena]|uniref:Tudor-knot domain-containing protein n=1 Tax=Candidatus Magnetomonas plexicatena TaxID=2552947 RepID=UPI0011033E75|nr:hypothetical protein E2O03_003180 [Nitrospirales bacterium LBB_01]
MVTKRHYGFALILTLTLALGFAVVSEAFTKGEKVEVLWKGTWYAATVLKAKGELTYIHYDGYNNSWDEWVGIDRIRTYGAAPVAAPPLPPTTTTTAPPNVNINIPNPFR